MSVATGAVVFTDLVGFTEYTAASGDEAAVQLLAMQDRVVRQLLPPDARIVKELGDGLMLFFGEACSAVTTMLQVLEAFDEAGNTEMLPLWVRVGGHWGSPQIRGTDLIGHDANVAARIADVASPGELLVSQALVQAGDHFDVDFSELGPVMMKGLEPIPLYRAEAIVSAADPVAGTAMAAP